MLRGENIILNLKIKMRMRKTTEKKPYKNFSNEVNQMKDVNILT